MHYTLLLPINYFFIILPLVIPIIALIWFLIKKKKQHLDVDNIQEEIVSEEPIASAIDESAIVELEKGNLEIEEIPVATISIDEDASYYYKVYEEHNGDNNEDKQYQETYYFKSGNLLKRKFDAEDWYNRRRIAISNKQLYFKGNRASNINFGVRLYFVDCINNEIDYLLKDEFGIDNRDNRMLEGLILQKAGFDKRSPIVNHVSNNKVDSINAFLEGSRFK